MFYWIYPNKITNKLTAMQKLTTIKGIISIGLLTILFCPGQLMATNYTGTWTSVTPSNTAVGSLSNYTLITTNPSSSGGASSNSYIPSGKTIVVTFPAGYTLNTVNGGTVNSTAITSGFTTGATTVTFNTPVAIAKSATITIVLNNITNNGTGDCYQISMVIDNETGTGSGYQNLFAASINSQYTLGTAFCYCTSNATNTADSYISNVTFNSINNSSSACNTYTNFIGTSTTVYPGMSYTLTISKGTCGGTYTGRFAAWIDWNKNGTFETSEQVLSDGAASNGPVSTSVTVPSGATTGTTKMRCIFVEGTSVPNQCGTYTWGETEDYPVTIAPLTACSGTPNAGTTSISTNSGCSGSATVLSSSGTNLYDGINYQWQKSIDGGTNWSNIGSYMTNVPVNYTDYPSVSSIYRLSASCSNSGLNAESNIVTYTVNSGSLSVKNWIGKGAGGTGTNFNDAANWSPAGVPVSCDSIRMILTSAATITLSANTSIGAFVYSVSGLVTCELDVQTYVLTINGSSTYDANGSGTWAQINVRSSGAGVINNGNCIFHNTGTGITYLYAATSNPGTFQLNANLTVGTGGRTAPAVEPKLIFDGPVAQSWILNNNITYFLGEDVIFGLTNSPVITMGGGGGYTALSVYDGNVQINNSTLVKAINCTLDRYTGTGTFTMASGSKLELSNTNDLPAPYNFSLDANSTVEYLGASSSQSVNGITYGHLIIGGSGSKTAANNMVIAGNFLVRNGATYNGSTRTHNFKQNFTNDGTFIPNTSTFIMDGTVNQYIQGTESPMFYNLTINKSSGIGYLGINTQVGTSSAGVLAFTAGPLDLNSRTLIINNNATGAVTRTSGYAISENVLNASKIQWNMGSTTGAHIFPFGSSAGVYIPFTFNLTAGTIGNVTISTYPTAADNTPYPVNPNLVTNVNGTDGLDNSANTIDRFWQIDKTGASGTATLTFIATPAEVGSIGSLKAQRWNTSTSVWEAPLPSQTSQAYGTTVPNVSNFSPWTLSGNDQPLPIELVSFEASYNGTDVDLLWTTSSEINNDYFTVERTIDGVNYIMINMVKGAGISTSILDYETVDQDPYIGLAYYRLKQTDYDGTSRYSNLEAVSINSDNSSMDVYPNPAKNKVHISFVTNSKEMTNLLIMDATGRVVYSTDFIPVQSETILNVDLIDFTNGMYLVTLRNTDEVLKTKFIKE